MYDADQILFKKKKKRKHLNMKVNKLNTDASITFCLLVSQTHKYRKKTHEI